MEIKKKNSFFFILILNIIKLIYSERKLIFVYEHVRHGARSPSSGYNSYFKDGVDEYRVNWKYDGELSAIGKRQHYLLGVRNRLRYGKEGLGLIDFTKYDPREILIHATEYNRTHQSINSELYGMYKNYKEETLNKEEESYYFVNTDYMKKSDPELLKEITSQLNIISNQVNNGSIPVFNIKPFPPNRIFLVDHCTKLDQYRDEKVGKVVKAFYEEFARDYKDSFLTFFNYPEYFTDYNKMKSITDHFICDYDNRKDLSIVKESGINLEDFLNFSKRFYGNFIFNWFIDEYTSGLEETHLMQDLIGYMERRIKHKNEVTYKAPKMVMDCGHDTTVGPIARYMSSAFNIKYHEFCEFACNVYYELYEEDGKYTVDYYLDDERLIHKMDFAEFKQKMESKYWNDTFAAQFCGKEEDTYIDKKKTKNKKLEDNSSLLLGTTILSITLFLIFLSSALIIFVRVKKIEKKFDENKLVTEELKGSEMPILD